MGLLRRPTPGETVEGGRLGRPCGPAALRAISDNQFAPSRHSPHFKDSTHSPGLAPLLPPGETVTMTDPTVETNESWPSCAQGHVPRAGGRDRQSLRSRRSRRRFGAVLVLALHVGLRLAYADLAPDPTSVLALAPCSCPPAWPSAVSGPPGPPPSPRRLNPTVDRSVAWFSYTPHMSEDVAATRIDRCKRAIAVVALAGSFMASLLFAEGERSSGHEDHGLSAVVRHQEHEPHSHPETGFVTRIVETRAIIVTGAPLPSRALPGWLE
jgi:hypothetical protein